MAAEIDMRTGVSEVSNVEFERHSDLNLSSREDLCEIGGECNGIVHDIAEEIDGDAKDDTDGAYVFVNGIDTGSVDPVEKDHDTDCVIDPTEASKTEIASNERIVSESDVDPMAGLAAEERQVEVQELRAEKGENSQSFKEETDVSFSNHDVAVEDLSSIESLAAPEKNLDCRDMVEKPDEEEEKRVEEHDKLESAANLKENQKVEVEVIEAIEPELHPHNDGEEKVEEPGKKMELFTGVEDHQESEVMVSHDVETNLDLEKEAEKLVDVFPLEGLPGDHGIEKLKSNLDHEREEEKVVDEIPLEGPPGELGIEKLVSNLDHMKEAERVADEIPLEGPPADLGIEKLESNLDHQNEAEKVVDEFPLEGPPGDLGIEKLESNLDHEKEAEKVVDEFPLEGPPGDLGIEKLKSEMAVCPVNNAADGSRNMPVLNECVGNAESLPCHLDDMKSENVVGNILIENDESLLNVPVDAAPLLSEVRFGSILISESFPICAAGDTRSEAEVRNFTVESSEGFPSFPVEDTKSKPEIGNDSVDGGESISSLPVTVVKSKSDEVSICTDDTVKIESENMGLVVESASNLLTCSDDVEMKTGSVNGSMETRSDLSSYSVADKKSKSVVENISGSSCSDMPGTDAPNLEYSGSPSKCVDDVIDVEIEGDLLTSGDGGDKSICLEAEGIEEIHRDETTQSSPKGSTTDDSDGRRLDAEVEKRPFQFLIRIPRYIDDKIREKIRLAQLQVDERTQSRDAIRAAIQMKRVTCSEYRDSFEAAKSEEIAARDVLTSKRQEIESVQTVINKIKNATSIEDIDVKIHNMEHMIEHETMPLKEEKQLIREIKQLKHIREQLSSNTGNQAELQQALDQRDKIEERFKLLKKELDSLRKEVLRTEVLTKAARKKYIDENEKLKELRSQFKAADDFRQQAYTNFQNLRKELYEKNKYFRTYKDDVKAANDYAFAGDKEALQRLCVNQVETVMDLWNKNDEFRSEYVRCNAMSTLRRLRTLDGRSLGPDEAPPILRNFVDDAVLTSAKINSTLPPSASSKQGNPVLSLRPEKGDAISVMKVEQKSQIAKTKKPTRATVLENGSATGSGREETEQHNEEEHKRAKQEEELARKAEGLRKEEAAAKLKEQRQLEEKAKAKEAEERRRRNTEKAQARAELRARKEAESREKEREKRAKKKERKREAVAQATTGGHEGESAENGQTESSLEPEIKEKPVTVAKRSQKPAASMVKQTRTKPIPLPLRNKGKRRMQPWMWILLVAMLVLVLFLAGNFGNFSKFELPNFGF